MCRAQCPLQGRGGQGKAHAPSPDKDTDKDTEHNTEQDDSQGQQTLEGLARFLPGAITLRRAIGVLRTLLTRRRVHVHQTFNNTGFDLVVSNKREACLYPNTWMKLDKT